MFGIDTNNDGVNDARQFAGATRYETALALAKAFAENNGGLGNVPVAFVASGESLIDAVAVSALAGDMNAPVLLTPQAELHRGVKNYIEDYGVGTVYVLGGTAAILDSVMTEIDNLANDPSVERIWGPGRHETAEQISRRITGAGSWCNTTAPSALLVNGGDMSLAGATAVAPLANRLAVPVLLTEVDELPEATLTFIEDKKIEHVVLVGGDTHISPAVASAVSAAGVEVVERIEGDSPAVLSVNIADLALGACSDYLLPVATDQVALVNGIGRDVSPDAITAAPYLADNELVPMLLVGDSLPASVSAWLAERPASAGGSKVEFKLLAIGGPNAVSESVMAAALEAARTADPLTVSITSGSGTAADDLKPPQHGASTFALRFSDAISVSNLTSMVGDLVTINGAPPLLASTAVTQNDDGCSTTIVTVTLGTGETLSAGDTIAVGSTTKIGDNDDKRELVRAEVKVPAKAVDKTGPQITLTAVEDKRTVDAAGVVVMNIESDTPLGTSNGDNVIVTVDNAATTATDEREFKVTRKDGPTLTLPDLTGNTVVLTDGKASPTVTPSASLKVGDTIIMSTGALRDNLGNRSPQASTTVAQAKTSPKMVSAYVSKPNHSQQASGAVPAAFLSATPSGAADSGSITITAKKDGDADGAYGNQWSVRLRQGSGYSATKAAGISVALDESRHSVVVTVLNGTPTYKQLKQKLDEHTRFSQLFDVKLGAYDHDNDTTTCKKASDELKLQVPATASTIDIGGTTETAGHTRVAIEVNFHTYLSAANGAGLLAAVLQSTDGRKPAAGGTPTAQEALGLSTLDADNSTVPTAAAPSKKVRYEALVDDANVWALPVPGSGNDLVRVAAGNDTTNVATGFAADDSATTAVDERYNSKEDTWIYESSSVKAPATPTA